MVVVVVVVVDDVVVTVYTACRDDPQQFRCHTTDVCVPAHYRCDGENHCGDWSDELYCSQSHTYSSLYAYAYGPADAIASQTPSSIVSFKSRLVLPSSYRVTQVVLEKRPLNGCSSGSGRGGGSSSSNSSTSSSSSEWPLVHCCLIN